MKPRFLLPPLLATLLVLLVASRWWFADQPRNVPLPTAGRSTGASATPVVPAQGGPATVQTRAAFLAAQAQDEQRLRRYLASFQQSLDLYGVVLEEQSQRPVVGARVRLGPIDHPGIGSQDSSPTVVYTDALGRFSFLGHRGLDLTVQVSKAGYYTLAHGSSAMFTHDPPSGHTDEQSFASDPAAPARLYLRQQGTPAAKLIHHELNRSVPRDGSAYQVNLAYGTQVVGVPGDLQIECWGNDDGIRGGTPFDWWCRVSVPGGGLQVRSDEFAFQAPEGGYQPGEEINMPAALGKQRWQDTFSRDYFVRLADGRYARMNFKIFPGGGHFFDATVYLNPTPGDRNLEAVADTKYKDYR